MLIDFFIICKRQIFVQFQFSLKKKLLSQDSYKFKLKEWIIKVVSIYRIEDCKSRNGNYGICYYFVNRVLNNVE